jgi:hypothetical protein
MRLALDVWARERPSGRTTAASGAAEGTLPIGEPGLQVLSCSGCNRPLRAGSRRCPACGMRFLVGVQLRRAVILLVAGFAVGLAAGGSIVTAGVVAGLPRVVGASVPSAASAPSQVGVATPIPVPTATPAPPDVPVPARSALRQIAALNTRLAAGVDALDAILAAPTFDAATAAAAIRSIATEAAAGTDQLARLATWSRATDLASDLRTFYDELRSTARLGLAASITNVDAYRTTAEAMAAHLARLPEIEARLAILLEAAGLATAGP